MLEVASNMLFFCSACFIFLQKQYDFENRLVPDYLYSIKKQLILFSCH